MGWHRRRLLQPNGRFPPRRGRFLKLQISGATESCANGIKNAAYKIAGQYPDQAVLHGSLYDYASNLNGSHEILADRGARTSPYKPSITPLRRKLT